jgi:predicted Zn-dependent protease
MPLILALLALGWYFLNAERYVNPETGKTAYVAMAPEQEEQLGLQAFQQVLSESKTISSGPEVDMVQRVAAKLVRNVDEASSKFDWRVTVVESDQVNAFCLPGGKIVVYTGILPIAKNEAGLATVMGHEIAHATARHGAQRMFQSSALQIAMGGLQGSMATMDPQAQKVLIGLMGAGAQYGVLLPFGRDHELEADKLGLVYMARAGYDPRESIAFWERMSAAAGAGKPPEMLSTHPADGTRITQLEKLMPQAMEIYNSTRGGGN